MFVVGLLSSKVSFKRVICVIDFLSYFKLIRLAAMYLLNTHDEQAILQCLLAKQRIAFRIAFVGINRQSE